MWTSGTMVDTWATVGLLRADRQERAPVGRRRHRRRAGADAGRPHIIEDNCFIGARSEVVEGCIVREGSVLGMGVFIGQSTKIVDRETGEVMYGEVPPSVGRGGLDAVEERRQPLLRGDREAGGRKDWRVQDLRSTSPSARTVSPGQRTVTVGKSATGPA
jgi:hypothetical protein